MKTSHFSENFDLCHPQLGSEQSNNNLTANTNFSSDISSKHDSITASAAVNYQTSSTSSTSAIASTYGSSSSDHQSHDRNANELLIKNQQRQQQQQEQNKKRKRETGEYFPPKKITVLILVLTCNRSCNIFSVCSTPSSIILLAHNYNCISPKTIKYSRDAPYINFKRNLAI